MKIKDLRISEDVADKLAWKHNLSIDEVYEVFWNDEDPLLIRHSQAGRGAYVAYGRTIAGRYLMVAFRLIVDNVAKIITARDMDASERKLYRE